MTRVYKSFDCAGKSYLHDKQNFKKRAKQLKTIINHEYINIAEMQVKSEKKALKRDSPTKEDGEPENGNAPPANAAKKSKLLNGGSEDVAVEKSSTDKINATMNLSIFEHFKELTNKEEEKRMKAALQLLQQLSKSKEAEKRQKELSYTLKRLVRGCGAGTNASRAGFYTGLVALLKAFGEQDITLEIIFDTMQKELHVGGTVGNKDDADAVVGKLLVCFALQQAGRLDNMQNNEYLERITNTILQATKQRTYHASLGFAVLIEFVEKLSAKQFATIVWPLLQVELQSSWPKQTLQTVHCLIAVQRRHPNIVNAKFLKSHFGNADLLYPESFPHLYRIFWEHGNMQQLTHPAFEIFGSYIAHSENLSNFWMQQIDAGLETSNKLKEIITLKVATDVFNSWQQQSTEKIDQKHAQVAALLSPNFMHLLVEGLKQQKQKKDETMKAFYDDFFEALVNCCTTQLKGDDKQLVAVIRSLILPPGLFSIEKYTSTRVVHQLVNVLGAKGVKKIYKIYHSIFLGTHPKNVENASEKWLNFERMNAGYMLQKLISHKAVRQEHDWRQQQLRFLLTCGICHVTDAGEVCKKEAASSFSNDFGEQCKNMFFTSMQSSLVDLQQEKLLLLSLAQYCNECIERKHAAKYFRITHFNESLHKYWQQMYDAVNADGNSDQKKEKSKSRKVTKGDNKLELVFQVLLLNMGLQLFREPEMAGPAIEDLLKCMQRFKEKQLKIKKKSKDAKTGAKDEEPEWIEVVVDLFLHLISQNAGALRNIVHALFPHLCDSLNLSAVHQILAVLNMKDGHNPLSAHGEESDEDTDAEEDDAESEVDGSKNKKSIEKCVNGKCEVKAEGDGSGEEDEDDGEAEEDDEDDEDEDDEDEDDDDDEVTAADKLRNAVSQALMTHGGMPPPGADDNDDMASIDLNDITEEQGRKLDEALADAFKVMRKNGGGDKAVKKSKSYRAKTTTVMHFRIRVLDLLEIYLQHQQPQLLILIEIMLALYNMLPYCVGDELKPLQIKVEKVLQKLTALKCDVAGVQESDVVSFIRLIVEEKSPTAVFGPMNKLRNKCIVFLVKSSNKIAAEKGTDSVQVQGLCQEYLEEFVNSRNPIVNTTLLSELFRLRWSGVWSLAVALAADGLNMEIRSFRRIQIYEILKVLYKNHDLHRLDVGSAKQHLKKIESALGNHIKALATNTTAEVSPKEYTVLLHLLIQAQQTHQRLQVKSALATAEIAQAVQSLRADTTQLYQRYCSAYELIAGHDKDKKKSKGKKLGEGLAEAEALKEQSSKLGSKMSDAVEHDVAHEPQKKRKTSKDKTLRKLKKQKKEQRLQAASAGLNGGFAYVRPASPGGGESADEEEKADA
ncbi:myb-binding protein 1A [Eurosta solidaginis]|uniref:myb-binding protein 1A n=1 Tax=Eurosta solidaginis TaxID=178769 RepID=UPI0035313158